MLCMVVGLEFDRDLCQALGQPWGQWVTWIYQSLIVASLNPSLQNNFIKKKLKPFQYSRWLGFMISQEQDDVTVC